MNWITVRHEAHGGETRIPAWSLAAYRKRGWHPLAEFDRVTPSPVPRAAEAAESEPVDAGDHIAEEN